MQDSFFVKGPQWLFCMNIAGRDGMQFTSPIAAMYMAHFAAQLTMRRANEMTFKVVKNRSPNDFGAYDGLLRGMFPNLTSNRSNGVLFFTIRDDDMIAFDLMADTALKLTPGMRPATFEYLARR